MSVGNDGQEVKSTLLALILFSKDLVNCSSGWSYSYRHTTEGANLNLTRKVQLDCASCLCVAFLFLIPNVPTHRHAADPMWVPSMRIIRQDHSALNPQVRCNTDRDSATERQQLECQYLFSTRRATLRYTFKEKQIREA